MTEKLDDLVKKEPVKSMQKLSDENYSDWWAAYTSISCMFTSLALTMDKDWMYIPAIGFGLAGVIKAAYPRYKFYREMRKIDSQAHSE